MDRIETLLNQIHVELQAVEHLLRSNQTCYATGGLVCTNCGRTPPSGARQCRPCKNTDLITKYCNSDSRIADYFAALTTARLWSSVEPFPSCSAAEIASRISQAKEFLRHSCQASAGPLKPELNMLVMRVTGIKHNTKGLDLYSLY